MTSVWRAFQNMNVSQDFWLFGSASAFMFIQSMYQWTIANTDSKHENPYTAWYHNSCSQFKPTSEKVLSFQVANVAAVGPFIVGLWSLSACLRSFNWVKPDQWRWIAHSGMYVILTILVLQIIGNLDLRSMIALCWSFVMYGLVGYYCELSKCREYEGLNGVAKTMMHSEASQWQTIRLSLAAIYILQLSYQYATVCRLPNVSENWSLFITVWTCLFPVLSWLFTWLLVKHDTKSTGTNAFQRTYKIQQRVYLLFYVIYFTIHSNSVVFGWS